MKTPLDITRITPHQLAHMREWLKDCEWQDISPEEIDALGGTAIVHAVKYHYEGGVTAFIRGL
jgi:hypothetical protein